jgi:hypothetical protein
LLLFCSRQLRFGCLRRPQPLDKTCAEDLLIQT